MHGNSILEKYQSCYIQICKCVKSTYPIVNHGLECMLEFLDESVWLKDINDSNKQKESLPLVIPGRDAPWGSVMGHVYRVTCCLLHNNIRSNLIFLSRLYKYLNALHGCRMRHQPLSRFLIKSSRPRLLIWLRERGFVRQSLLALLGGHVKVVDPDQEGVVHDLEGLQHPAVSLHGFAQGVVGVRLQE